MKLLFIHVISAATCGGLLDGFKRRLRDHLTEYAVFDPLCLIGPNGSGKSQLLQAVAEMLQAAFHACVPTEERQDGNPKLQFELEYLIRHSKGEQPVRVRLARVGDGRHRPALRIQRWERGEWLECELTESTAATLLPAKVVGYTSGDNETLSLPFLVSRGGYAKDVRTHALDQTLRKQPVSETRLIQVDYATHLEVFVANLLLGSEEERKALLEGASLTDIHSFRCIVQLAHAGKAPPKVRAWSRRKGVQLTEELERHLDALVRCATCYTYEDKTESYVLDYWINDDTRAAFRAFWGNAWELYSTFHKLAMLNDLMIPQKARKRFSRETKERRFASRLPEPQEELKVFRFERVQLRSVHPECGPVDYVALSDGEHQLGQLLGAMCMLSFPGILFLLDEPESHFNPKWRTKAISRILDLPTAHGPRRSSTAGNGSCEQECLLTTHSPFVPSDMHREKVLIFSRPNGRASVRNPNIETYGTTFDTILEECFEVRPPISAEPLKEIQDAKDSGKANVIRETMKQLGDSVEKVFLADKLRQVEKLEGG